MKEAGILFYIICLYCSVCLNEAVAVNGRAEVVTSSSLLLFQLQVRTRVLASLCLKYGLAKYVLASHRVRSTRARN